MAHKPLIRRHHKHQPGHVGCRNWRGLAGEGVEIGVHKGGFSCLLLETWEGTKLYSVDPWRNFPASEYDDVCNVSQENQEEFFQETCKRLSPFRDRSEIIRTTSDQAADRFKAGSLDFVYLDAQHHFEAIKEDIAIWAPKIRKGGILGGHDYLDGTIESGSYGVKRAVDEFSRDQGIQPIVTREPVYRSWFFVINK